MATASNITPLINISLKHNAVTKPLHTRIEARKNDRYSPFYGDPYILSKSINKKAPPITPERKKSYLEVNNMVAKIYGLSVISRRG